MCEVGMGEGNMSECSTSGALDSVAQCEDGHGTAISVNECEDGHGTAISVNERAR